MLRWRTINFARRPELRKFVRNRTGRTNDMGFIDGFHYDRDGMRALCDDFAGSIQTLL